VQNAAGQQTWSSNHFNRRRYGRWHICYLPLAPASNLGVREIIKPDGQTTVSYAADKAKRQALRRPRK
jgi:hypothetical protein